MAKHKFEWFDGTTVEFEDFKLNSEKVIYCRLPETGKGRGNSNTHIHIFVTDADYNAQGGNSRYSWGASRSDPAAKTALCDPNLIRVGVLRDNSSLGFPAGSYIPYKVSAKYNNGTHVMDGLTGDIIVHPDYVGKGVLNETV